MNEMPGVFSEKDMALARVRLEQFISDPHDPIIRAAIAGWLERALAEIAKKDAVIAGLVEAGETLSNDADLLAMNAEDHSGHPHFTGDAPCSLPGDVNAVRKGRAMWIKAKTAAQPEAGGGKE
jgi:hypothetical protein